MYDIVIVGSGPAGSTFAARLPKKYKILLLDKRQLDQEEGRIEKCCGGLIAPDAQHMLAKMGKGIPKNILTGPQIFTVKTLDFDNNLERYYQRHYINVDRQKFDRWLIEDIGDNVTCLYGASFKTIGRCDEGYKIKFTYNNRTQVVKTRFIVGADGARSRVRDYVQPNYGEANRPRVYTAIEEWFPLTSSMPYFISIFDQQITDFYSWIIPKEDAFVLGSAIPRGEDANGKFRTLKKYLTQYGIKTKEPIKRQGALINRPMGLHQICTGSRGLFLIGEAAGLISPSSSEGISYAFRSALALADAFKTEENNIQERYKKCISRLYANILLKEIKSPVMYDPVLRKAVMKTGVLAMKVVEEINGK